MAGGDVFRRTYDGEVLKFDSGGLWGSGNVMIERTTDDPTGFSSWDGTALWGRHRPGKLERFPVLNGILTGPEFHERFRALGDDCMVWTGEDTGFDCDAVCSNLGAVCGEIPEDCLASCRSMPRALTDCLRTTDSCLHSGEVCQVSGPYLQITDSGSRSR